MGSLRAHFSVRSFRIRRFEGTNFLLIRICQTFHLLYVQLRTNSADVRKYSSTWEAVIFLYGVNVDSITI
jgi:hypothetical protein